MDYTIRHLEKVIKICLLPTGALLSNIAATSHTWLFKFTLVKTEEFTFSDTQATLQVLGSPMWLMAADGTAQVHSISSP